MLNSKKKCNFAALFVFSAKTLSIKTQKTHTKHTMVHLTNTLRSATFLLGTAILMLFFFCAPMHAQTPTFKSTSSYKIVNPNYSAQQLDPTTIGHQTYRSTIYTPFGSGTPSSNNPSGNSGSGGSGDPNDDVGIPGWADTPSEPLPIGDGMGILLLMATMMVGAIFLKQRKQLSESISKSTTSTTNINNLRGNQLPTALKKENNPTQHMTTRKQTYQSLRQKLFLLSVFVCTAGQVSADKTIYFRPSTTQFKAGWNGTNKQTPYNDVYWTKGTSNFFPIELRNSNTESYSSIWTEYSNLVEANNITGYNGATHKSRFIKITVPNGYNYIVAYRAVWSYISEDQTNCKTAYDTWKKGNGAQTRNVENQNTIPTKNKNNGHRPNSPELIPTDGRNLLACREGWWDNWYWAYYLPHNNDVRVYFANLYDWPNLQLLFGKDIYSIASWTFTHIENTKLYQRTLNYSDFEVGYEQYGFISNPTDATKFSPSHQIDPCKHNSVNNAGNEKYFNGTVPGAGTVTKNGTFNEVQEVADNMIANRIKTANKYTALQANLLSGSELFIPESGENGTAASKSHLTNGWQDLNHIVTIKSYVYNLETKSFDINSNDGGYITYYTHQLTGASTATRFPDSGTNTIDAASGTFTAAYTAKTELTAIPKPGYRFAGWYDDAGTLIYADAHHPHHAVKNEDYTIHARFVANDVTCFKYRVQTCESGNVFTTSTDDCSAKGGTIHITATDGQSLTISEENGNDKKYQYLYHHDDEIITCTAEPKQNYVFIGWWNNGKGPYTVNPWITQADTTNDYVTARFASIDNVKKQTINISGSGKVDINYQYSDASGLRTTKTIAQNTFVNAWNNSSVTLTAEALAGYEFDGWYEGGNKITEGVSGNKLTYTATLAHTITAKFVSEINKLTVSVLNYNTSYNEFREYEYEYNKVALTGGGKSLESYSSFSCEFKEATNVTLTATPERDKETGYDFIGWYQNNTLLSKEETISLNVIGMQAISAHFAPTKCFNVRLLSPKGGTYSVKYARESLFNQEGMCYVVNTPYDKEINIYVPYDAKIAVINPKPINGYEYRGFKVFHGNNNNDGTFSIIPPSGKDKYEEVDLPAVIPNFVRTEEQVVYLDISNKDKDSDWADVTTFQCNKRNPANNIVNEKVPFTEKVDEFANIYKITIKENTYDNIDIIGNNNTKEHTTGRLAIPSTRYNCFKLNAYQSSTGEWVDAWTTLPTLEGDYRLIYREQTVVNKNEIHIDYEFNEGDRIKNINFTNPTADTQTDIVSLHIYNKVSGNVNGVNNPEVILQQWSDNEDDWVDVERYMVFGPLRSNNTGVIKMPNRKNTTGEKISVDQGIGKIIAAAATDDDKGCGVWNFVIQQTIDNGNVTAKLLVNETHRYEGDYYIRTTNADGQYNNYIHPGNVMKFSEYAAANSDYSHYFIRNVDINEDGTPTSQAGKHNQVKFTVATAYTEFLCKELMINNNRFSEDEYENDIFVINDNNNPKLPADASVRFGWDRVTNRLTRAYIANTTIKNNEYLVVEGTNIGSPSGDATYFTDNSNWLYTIDLNATADATAKVKAKMNGQYQYFMGSESEKQALITGNGANTYPIRLLYDFKDDRFTTIYRPDGQLEGTINVNTPLMIERVHNDEPTQIKLTTNEHTVTPTGSGEDQYTQPAYAVMTFLEEKLASKDITHHEKMFYWISFPFNVCIRDVFGLGDYGKYWIMEEYDGAQRAASGLAQNNWKYITKKSAVLSKNVGYVLCLNYSQILQDQLFKSYGGSDKTLNSGKLSLYFPSNGVISPAAIKGGQERTVSLTQYENNNTAWNHHNWHIIGVPSFADPKFSTTQGDVPFFYQYWHPTDGYAAVASTEVDFYAMHAYMVQYTGDIKWTSVVNTGDGNVTQKGLAAKTDEQADKKLMLRLELQQAGSTLDKTYVQLRNDKGTKGFDMSLDLTKIINAGANIYSIVDNHEMAGNAIPKDETVLPLGVVITAAGDYTFAMPNGTEGMIVELIDYEQGTSTNLLVGDYTVNMPEGTNNTRFALRLKPDKVATSVEDITSGTNDNNVRKLLIDGVLYLVKDGAVYDAQGHCVR